MMSAKIRPKTTTKKTVSKTCSECEAQVPVACKACPCGHSFYIKRADPCQAPGTEDCSASKTPPPSGFEPNSPGAAGTSAGSGIDISPRRRRTERVKRERPNYFNALEFVSPTSRRRRTTSASQSSGTDDPPKKKRGRPRTNFKNKDDSEPKSADKEVDVYANVPVEKVLQYKVILAEINRKFSTQTFRP